ncbi:MAG: PAC2 domain containing protein [Cenarchaeum symbiont of Oopsacas minuta]|nr:PAC2 domain containing protein [Cenarchaeum symbiont of Oopsacas minuta]
MTTENFPTAEIVEMNGTILKEPIIFAGFVGAGLVGPLSIGHIIEELHMKKVAYIRSRHMPPSTVFTSGMLRYPFRIYASDDGKSCCIICEVTLKMEGIYDIIGSILEWVKKINARELVILDGVVGEHDGKTYYAAEQDRNKEMEKNDISIITQGFITGVPGGILGECLMYKVQGSVLLAKAEKKKPDPVAAALLLESVNRLYGINVDAKKMLKNKERIGSDFSDMSKKYTEHSEKYSGMYM